MSPPVNVTGITAGAVSVPVKVQDCWNCVTHGPRVRSQALDGARCIAQALLDRGLTAERPVAILSENDLEHALLALACLSAGVPFCPVSPTCSIVSQDCAKLRRALQTLTPGLVFAADGARYGKAIAAAVPSGTEVVLATGSLLDRPATAFDDLLDVTPALAVDAAMQATGPHSIAKLVPLDGKTQVRYRGPTVTPGYWRAPAATAEAFDEEGFFRTGDAVGWIAGHDVHQGLRFDGRIAGDFKLGTGTFVSVGPLRAKIIAAGLAASATGSASRVARLHLMHEPPSIDRSEVTDKGSINQRAVLQERAALVVALHQGSLPFTLQPQGGTV